jgi:hypothetical protein
MLKKFRQARSLQPELQEAAWADEQKMGEHGKRFMTTANKVMVCYILMYTFCTICTYIY